MHTMPKETRKTYAKDMTRATQILVVDVDMFQSQRELREIEAVYSRHSLVVSKGTAQTFLCMLAVV